MTLISTITSKNDFVIMTGDRMAIAERPDGTVYPLSFDSRKVSRLTERVLYADAGRVDLTQTIEKALREKINDSDDLKVCAIKLKDVISELKEDEKVNELLNERNNAGIFLSGFYRNGTAGLISYESGSGINEYTNNDYPFLAEVNIPFANESEGDIFAVSIIDKLDEEGITLDDAVTRLIRLHKYTSYLCDDRVSSDFDLFVLRRKDDEYILDKRYFDNDVLYRALPSKEELAYELATNHIRIRKELTGSQ